MVYYMGTYSGYSLQHHGILGMKWGKRNGPPYPLNGPDHSQSEKKAGWRKSLSRSSNEEPRKKEIKNSEKHKGRRKLTPEQKRNIAIAAAALAIVGGTSYYLAKTGKMDKLIAAGRNAVNEFRFPEESVNRADVKRINAALKETPEGSINCVHCSVSEFLNHHFKMSTTAKGHYGVDEVSGMVFPGGRDGRVLQGIFDNMKYHNVISEQHLTYFPRTSLFRNKIWSKTFASIPSDSEGIMYLTSPKGGHAVRYIKNAKGIVAFLDPQTGDSLTLHAAKIEYGRLGFIPTEFYDLTNATLLPNARNVLKYFVNGF